MASGQVKAKTSDYSTKAIANEVELSKCKQDIAYFIEQYVLVNGKPVKLTPMQRRLLHHLQAIQCRQHGRSMLQQCMLLLVDVSETILIIKTSFAEENFGMVKVRKNLLTGFSITDTSAPVNEISTIFGKCVEKTEHCV